MAEKFLSTDEKEDSGDEEFKDALSEPKKPNEAGELDFETAKAKMTAVVDLMLVNRYQEALRTVQPWVESNMYCAVAASCITFCRALMTFDRDMIQEGLAGLKAAMELCNAQRHKQGVVASVMTWFQGRKIGDYTQSEQIAEVFHAGCNLLSAILIFVQDESILNFVKSGLRIQACHSQYKSCYSWLQEADRNGDVVEENVSSGIRMGIGTFNLIVSLLPPRLLRVLEFIGFSGDREKGLEELRRAGSGRTLFSALASVNLLFHHCVTSSLLGFEESGVEHAEHLLGEMAQRYPDSHVFTYFIGRFEMINGHMTQALKVFSMFSDASIEWTQIRHLYYWEMIWCHCAKCEWKQAVHLAEILSEQSRWSKTIFLYILGALLVMWRREWESSARGAQLGPAEKQGDGDGGEEEEEKREGEDGSSRLEEDGSSELEEDVPPSLDDIRDVMLRVPLHLKKIAGRSLPMERLSVIRAEQFLKGNRVPLPLFELFYGWNVFQMTGKNEELTRKHLKLVQQEIEQLEEAEGPNEPCSEDYCLVKLIEGVCYKGLRQWEAAQSSFQMVIDRGRGLVQCEYLVPAATMEMGLVHIELGKLDSASRWLLLAKNNYRGYVLEFRVNFRIHAGLMKINQHPHSC